MYGLRACTSAEHEWCCSFLTFVFCMHIACCTKRCSFVVWCSFVGAESVSVMTAHSVSTCLCECQSLRLIDNNCGRSGLQKSQCRCHMAHASSDSNLCTLQRSAHWSMQAPYLAPSLHCQNRLEHDANMSHALIDTAVARSGSDVPSRFPPREIFLTIVWM